MTVLPDFLAGLGPKDFMFDGFPIRGERRLEMWSQLDWSRACVDMGPSPAGNPGPYWHVPRIEDDDETVHRLYPKLGKWLPLVRRAIEEHGAQVARAASQSIAPLRGNGAPQARAVNQRAR